MPNWVENHLRIRGNKNIVDEFENKLIFDNNFSFNNVIPEPVKQNECPKEFWVNENSHIMELEDRPWFDWYAWHISNWGTKWDADVIDIYKSGHGSNSEINIIFNTAWDCPWQIYDKLGDMFPSAIIEVTYADEDIFGGNAGEFTIHNGNIEYSDRDPIEIGKEVWGYDI